MIQSVSILIGKRDGELVYWKVFADRTKAERQKVDFENYDKIHNTTNWEYFIQDERIIF